MFFLNIHEKQGGSPEMQCRKLAEKFAGFRRTVIVHMQET